MLFHIWNPLLEWQVRHCINFYFPSHFNMLFHPTQLLIILIYYTTSISHDFLIEFYFLIRSPPYKVITLFGFMNIMVSTGIFLPLELFFPSTKIFFFTFWNLWQWVYPICLVFSVTPTQCDIHGTVTITPHSWSKLLESVLVCLFVWSTFSFLFSP